MKTTRGLILSSQLIGSLGKLYLYLTVIFIGLSLIASESLF